MQSDYKKGDFISALTPDGNLERFQIISVGTKLIYLVSAEYVNDGTWICDKTITPLAASRLKSQ